jgi:hypothetical protein
MRFGIVLSSLAMLCLCPSSLLAADWYTGSGATTSASDQPHEALDLALTGTTQGSYYGTAIGTIAPFAPLTESGMRLRLSGVLGTYSYISSAAGIGRVTGTQEDGSFLVGYEWVSRVTSVAVYVGGDLSNNTLDKKDPSNPVSGVAVGAKVGLDFYSNPTTYSMISGNVSYSTANNSYYTRFKVGLSIADGVFAGPEALFLGDNQYSQWRIGAHVTGLRFGALQFGLSGGFLSDRVRGKGAYAIVDARVTF